MALHTTTVPTPCADAPTPRPSTCTLACAPSEARSSTYTMPAAEACTAATVSTAPPASNAAGTATSAPAAAEATEAVLQDGWYYSGDMGRIDEDGFLHFEGRNKEMIKSSGYSVFPEEVERMMLRHPDIQQVAVVGYADPVRGESVRAFVVPRPGAALQEADVIEWSRERMAAYKYPRSVRIVEDIPSTSTGKMLRLKLKDA